MAALRALLAEDSALIMFGLESVLEEHGMEIAGSAATLAQAMHLAKSVDCDIAILDVNLKEEMVFPAADILIGRGIPVVLATGYELQGDLPTRFADVIKVVKPYEPETLLQAVELSLAMLKG